MVLGLIFTDVIRLTCRWYVLLCVFLIGVGWTLAWVSCGHTF